MPHIYWRLNMTENNNSTNTAVAECQMRATSGGTDQCTGGTASASGDIGASYAAASAFDNVASTMWNVGNKACWLRYQFASAVEIIEYTIQARHDGFLNDMSRNWTFEWSDNGTSWTPVHSMLGQRAWGVSEVRTFTLGSPGGNTHRFWRFNFTENNGHANLAVAEVQMRATIGGADQCTGGAAGASDENIVPAAQAFDDNASVHWVGGNPTGFLQYFRNTPIAVVEYTLQARGDGFLTSCPRAWTFQWSDDGLSWTTVDTRTNQTGWGLGEIRTYIVPVSIAPYLLVSVST